MRQGRPRNDGLGMRPGWSGNETREFQRECRRPGKSEDKPREIWERDKENENRIICYVCYLSSLLRNDPGIITIATCLTIM